MNGSIKKKPDFESLTSVCILLSVPDALSKDKSGQLACCKRALALTFRRVFVLLLQNILKKISKKGKSGMIKSDFDLYFDFAFKTNNQTKFEEWFAAMAACVYSTDFELIKAGGHHGDKKSDGRRISTETIYQCYAPESPKAFADKAPAKIADSFPEVTTYWPGLKEWVFVHNNTEGLPTSASDALEKIRELYPNVTISAPSPPRRFLKDTFHDQLSLQQLIDLYPSASRNFLAVSMEDIRPLLKKVIAEKPVQPDPAAFGELPDEAKLDFNKLSPDAKYDLNRARAHVDIVDRYLSGMSNPQHASMIQAQMRAKYEEARDLGYNPDEILGRLLTYVGGDGTPTVSAAAYVVLAYYFDACDIFENVPSAIAC